VSDEACARVNKLACKGVEARVKPSENLPARGNVFFNFHADGGCRKTAMSDRRNRLAREISGRVDRAEFKTRNLWSDWRTIGLVRIAHVDGSIQGYAMPRQLIRSRIL